MADEDFAEELEGFEFAAGLCTWRRDTFNELIHDIAEDRTALLLFVSLDIGRAYGPYDGGADLFFESAKTRDEFADRFSSGARRVGMVSRRGPRPGFPPR